MRVRAWEYGPFEYKLMSDDTEEALTGVLAVYKPEWSGHVGTSAQTGPYLLVWREVRPLAVAS